MFPLHSWTHSTTRHHDASVVGLCVLVPSRLLALTYQFQPGDRKLINELKAGETNEFEISY
ncbi:hypothetical protein PHMEG_00023339 [Phytophthora megakarya]|uniref:Uncharacterized protein n=1 Tax=Phytophthora megakarya TaxID=4795 RepID=A0A225VGL5_9STRA|nr:hypothetical protein PHMEG_00023339 [Phytophthora megakarya]